MSVLLQVKGLEAFHGAARVLHGIDFEIAAGGVTAVLGANGAGKTAILRAISALIRTRGEIWLEGRRIERLPTEAIAALGVAHVPDDRGTLVNLTVEENLRVGAYLCREREIVQERIERVCGYFPRLRERLAQQAGTLSGGEQQMLAIGRALMMQPRLLLVDEPSFGLAPHVIDEVFDFMQHVNRQESVAILLVEQNVTRALSLADHALLLETGRVVLAGTSAALRSDERLRRAYLGG
ncbi:ABC transporter ATP-binding protein [Variovorax sp. LjRoot290]|uniref:ABC transporter ATP-binding protein n=1 Tax=Variovorax sp. LjRoot290 TaxID=3342316 RepID=UPI003ECE8A94